MRSRLGLGRAAPLEPFSSEQTSRRAASGFLATALALLFCVGACTVPAVFAPLGSACADEGYQGFACRADDVRSAAHGVRFSYLVRWNLAELESPRASTIFLLGGDGRGQFRTQFNGRAIQDPLAEDAIRSVEVEFTHPEGYWRPPQRGYPDTSAVYAAIVEKLVEQRILAGAWITHIGGSNGAALAAAGLAHHRLGRRIARFVLLSGPFLSDLQHECSDTRFSAFIDVPQTRAFIDAWNGWAGPERQYCERQAAHSEPSYVSRSVLGAGAAEYSGVSLTTIMGAEDVFGPWILRSNKLWYESVSAHKNRYVIEGLGHDVLGAPERESDERVDYALELTLRHAQLEPGQRPQQKPLAVFSRIEGGPATTEFSTSRPFFGRVNGVGAKAQICVEAPETPPGHCGGLRRWQSPEASGWRFDTQRKQWSTRIVPATLGMQAGLYRVAWRNGESQQHADTVDLVLR